MRLWVSVQKVQYASSLALPIVYVYIHVHWVSLLHIINRAVPAHPSIACVYIHVHWVSLLHIINSAVPAHPSIAYMYTLLVNDLMAYRFKIKVTPRLKNVEREDTNKCFMNVLFHNKGMDMTRSI